MGNSLAKSLRCDGQRGGAIDAKISRLEDGAALDIIVAQYILSMNMESLSDLRKPDKCQEITQLTSESFNRTATTGDILAKHNVMYGRNASKYESFMCNEVVDVYINVSKIYAAIVANIRPSNEYRDDNGQISTIRMSGSADSDTDVFGEELAISKLSFCGAKIESLTGNGAVCKKDDSVNAMESHLDIPELYDLYCDADYDVQTGVFLGMSDENREEFVTDLTKFYQIFTGNTTLPATIKRFGDIPLTDYNKSNICKYRNFSAEDCYDELGNSVQCSAVQKQKQKQSISKDVKGRLLETYATNLRNMVSNVNSRQSNLISILNELFMFDDTLTREVRVSALITSERVRDIMSSIRELVNQINMSCSIDYMNGIRVYEAIVDLQALDTSVKQMSYINRLREMIRNPGSA